jgi:phosphoglycolate phosphatase-like HAD superfamily hydrolase
MASLNESRETEAVIFDFDGVIANSGQIFKETLQEVLKRPKPFTDKEVRELRDSSFKEVVSKLGIKRWQLPLIAMKGRRAIARKMDRVEIFPGLPEALKDLKKQGYKLYILSSSSEAAIKNFLNRYKLSPLITSVHSAASLVNKPRRLKGLMAKEALSPEVCLYIGDETRDLDAAHATGVRCLAVEWGYNSPKALKAHKPTAMARRPADLVQKIKSL